MEASKFAEASFFIKLIKATLGSAERLSAYFKTLHPATLEALVNRLKEEKHGKDEASGLLIA